jgi:hypothetical protein
MRDKFSIQAQNKKKAKKNNFTLFVESLEYKDYQCDNNAGNT